MIYNEWGMRAGSKWFADCCGATYKWHPDEKTKVTALHKGILVFDRIIGKEYKGKKQDVSHIKTRNGNLTICIRHTY